jgi:hypothetical protein
MKYFTFLLLLAGSFSIQVTQAQNDTNIVEGIVIDGNTKQPMPFVTIAVFRNTNSPDSLIGGSQTTDQGHFTITKLPTEVLRVRLSFVGYQTTERTFTLTGQPIHLGTLELLPEMRLLQEVTIRGEKATIEITPEKRVFNVAKNLTTIGSTAESLLRNVPSLTIDESGAASMRNMPTTIYVNGKPTQLTLAQIPADQIESVEVISNPSARYEAATTGGIVNLVLKQNRQPGYNGMVSVGLGNNSRYDATANIDWQTGKWNLTALYSLNATRNPLNGYVSRVNRTMEGIATDYFDQITDINLNNLFQSGRIAANYHLNERNIFSMVATVVDGAFNTVSNQQYTYHDASRKLVNYGSRSTAPHNNYTNMSLEFDWKHQFARKGQELRLITSFTRNRVANAGDWLTTAFEVKPDATSGKAQVGYPVRNRISGRILGIQSLVQLDYVHPINESAKWEFGLRSFTYVRDQQYLFSELSLNSLDYRLLPNYSQNVRISEMVNGAYALYSQKLAHQWSIEAGLRLEQSSLHGLSRFDGSTFGYDYPSHTGQHLFQSFFPSFSVSKKQSETSEWNLSLSRKIGRPNFRHTFVGIQANDQQNITIGNPKVRPEFDNTAEMSYNKTWTQKSGGSLQWLATGYYIYQDHTIKPLVQPLATDSSILVTSYQNVKADIRYGIDNTLSYTTGPLTIVANLNAYEIIYQSVNFTNRLVGYDAKLNLTYQFGVGISAQLSGERSSKSPKLQGYNKAINGIDFALRKGFWQKRANITFMINDVFNSRRAIAIYDQPTTFQTSMNRREVRFYKLTLQLSLGKTNGSKLKEKKVERPDIDFSN